MGVFWNYSVAITWPLRYAVQPTPHATVSPAVLFGFKVLGANTTFSAPSP